MTTKPLDLTKPEPRIRLTADPTDPAVQARLAAKFGDVQATPEPTVTYATVRAAYDELHIECRFSDGQKFAAVTVAQGFDNLAHRIETMLNESQQATPEPVARSRECTEPMCACVGGPCAECPEGEREKEIADLRTSRDFYKRRADALQQAQSQMRDPERTMVCDILANGALLVPAGGRYAATPEPVGEVVAWLSTDCIGERYLCFTKPQDSDTVRPLVFGDTHPAPAPQQVPMTRASRDVIMAKRTADGDADEWPEPWAYKLDWEDAEAHHGINAQAKGEQG